MSVLTGTVQTVPKAVVRAKAPLRERIHSVLERHPLIALEAAVFIAPPLLLLAVSAVVCAAALPLCWFLGLI